MEKSGRKRESHKVGESGEKRESQERKSGESGSRKEESRKVKE